MRKEKKETLFVGWAVPTTSKNGVPGTPYILKSIFCAIIMFILSGCGNNIQKPLPVCPGKSNVTESLAALQVQPENMIPLYTNKGNFSIEYYANNELQKQHFNIRHFIIKPPLEIFMQAGTGIIDKAMILGSNAQDFWLDIIPDPINSYLWGKWSDQGKDAGTMTIRKTMLEALGLAEIDTNADWSLSNEGPYDILTKTENGIVNKKLYIYSCDYRVRKIEYFDSHGDPVVLAKLDKYKEVSPGFFIPFSIKVNSLSENIEKTLNIKIDLETLDPATEARKNYKIDFPKTPNRDHVYQIIDGQWFE